MCVRGPTTGDSSGCLCLLHKNKYIGVAVMNQQVLYNCSQEILIAYANLDSSVLITIDTCACYLISAFTV